MKAIHKFIGSSLHRVYWFGLVVVVSFIFGVANSAVSSAATIDLVGISPDRQSSGSAINDHGVVVGSSNGQAYFWQDGTMRNLGTLGGRISHAYGINNNNQVVGYSHTSTDQSHAFLWSDGTMQDLAPLVGTGTFAYDINDSGVIVGTKSSSGGLSMFILDTTTGEVTTPGNGIIATHINNDNQIAGFRVVNGIYRATLWHNDTTTDLGMLDGHTNSRAQAINNHGAVVGISGNSTQDFQPFYWKNGQMKKIGPSVGANSAYGINDDGQIIGTNYVGDRVASAFVWDNDVIHDFDLGGAQTYGVAINNNGQVVVESGEQTYAGSISDSKPKSIQQIIADIQQFRDEGEIRYADAAQLIALLQKAEEKADKPPATCKILEITARKIAVLQEESRLPAMVASQLTDDIQEVRTSLDCD